MGLCGIYMDLPSGKRTFLWKMDEHGPIIDYTVYSTTFIRFTKMVIFHTWSYWRVIQTCVFYDLMDRWFPSKFMVTMAFSRVWLAS